MHKVIGVIYTESQHYRQLGIIAYGWAPIYTTAEELYEVVRDISR